MKPSSIISTLLSVLLAMSTASAQDTTAPAALAAAAQTEMQKWIATTDEQWQATFKREVADAQVLELEKLKQQYVSLLDTAATKASAAGDLDGVVALRNEEKRFAGTNLLPEADEATEAASVKQIRGAVRAQIARLEKDSAARTKALHVKYDALLADAQSRLTKAQRIEDALLVKAKRDEVAKVWITPAITAALAVPAAPVGPGTPAKPDPGTVKKPAPPVPPASPPASLNSQLRETKWQLSGGKSFILHADGTSTSSWTPRKGSWKVTGPNAVELRVMNTTSLRKGTVNPERTTITMSSGTPGDVAEVATLVKP